MNNEKFYVQYRLTKNARHQTAVLIIYYKYKKFFALLHQFEEFFLIFLFVTSL